MDKRREELEEQKADLHLALLMDEYAERMGKQAREEAEAAYERGELQRSPELDAAFRKMLADSTDADNTKKPMKAVTRYALVAAVTVVLLFGTLIAAQAAGIDVFGSIATWTDSVFHFQNDIEAYGNEVIAESGDRIRTALQEFGMPEELGPVILPKGYEITEITKDSIEGLKVLTVYAECKDHPQIRITIREKERAELGSPDWEKNEETASEYTVNNRLFYIFKNMGWWTGAWSDHEYSIVIFGAETEDALKTIIDSIGGCL